MKFRENKFIKKADIKAAAVIISFVLVLALILEALSLGSFSKMTALTYKNNFYKTYSFLSEPDNSIDIAAIGSSDLYSAFVPMQLYEKYGYTSTIISSPHQTVRQSLGFLDELLDTQKPRVLIIETDMLYEGAEDFDASNTAAEKIMRMRRKATNFFGNFDANRFDDIIKSHFSIFIFHDKWKNVKKDKLDNPFKSESFTTCDHGYNFNNSVKPAKVNESMAVTDVREPIDGENIYYLNKMLKRCKDNNIDVILVEMPTQNAWSYYRHNAVSDYARENGVEFIDFNLMFDEISLDITKDYRDGGDHLNYYGATKTTTYLSDYLSARYSAELTDKRTDPTYTYWDISNTEFREKYNIK